MEIPTGKRLKSRREKSGKVISRREKIGKSDFAPPEKFPCYAPVEKRLLYCVRACAEISKELNLYRADRTKNSSLFIPPDI